MTLHSEATECISLQLACEMVVYKTLKLSVLLSTLSPPWFLKEEMSSMLLKLCGVSALYRTVSVYSHASHSLKHATYIHYFKSYIFAKYLFSQEFIVFICILSLKITQ